jgi:hypothetical protein
VRTKRIWAGTVAGFLLLLLISPQLALADGPAISNVVVDPTSITSTSATIFWITNTSSTSRVNYGTNSTLGKYVYDSSTVTTHFVPLTSLTPNTTYYFDVQSTDATGTTIDDNTGAYYQFTTLQVTSYNITLTPACGVCGELIEVGVCGEVIKATALVAMAGTYHICWDSLTNVKETFTTTMAGTYEATFFLPEATKGDHKVYLVDNTYAQKAAADYQVGPSVKIDPEEGPVSTAVTLNGYGFDASQGVQVTLFQGEVQKGAVQTGTANSVGSWNLTYTIPDTPAGGYTFKVEAKEGTVWVNWVSKSFEVTPQITAPSSGTVGHTIEVKGTGFQSKEKNIKVTFDGEVGKTNSPIVADENGSWTAVIVVPALQSGSYTISASGESTRARDVTGVKDFILGAGIFVEPISAYVGDTITVNGGGFATGETGIKVTFEGSVVASGITAKTDGTWESSFVLPVSTYGSNTVSASGDITAAVTNTLKTEARIIEISPDKGGPGDLVSLTGNGFGGNQALTVTIGGVAVSENVLSQTNGNVVISFHVPKGSIEGTRNLVVTDGSGATASYDFTVTQKTLSTTPLPISPKRNTLRSGAVTFRWQGITSGSNITYTLEISPTASFANTWSKSDIEGSSYTLTDTPAATETLPPGTYYWRVHLVDDYGNESAWSDSTEFRVSPIPTWVWVLVGVVVLVGLMVVAYRETKFKVTE